MPRTTYTLHVETLPDQPGIWLVVCDGKSSRPVAQFTSAEAAQVFKDAFSLAQIKAHAMGMLGI